MTTQVKNTLDEVLEDYADLGFSLKEETDHILELWFKDKRIKIFNQLEVIKETLWQACQDELDRLNGKGKSVEE